MKTVRRNDKNFHNIIKEKFTLFFCADGQTTRIHQLCCFESSLIQGSDP